MNFDEMIQLQLLKLKATVSGRTGGAFLDQLLEEAGETPQIRQMCAKVSSVMYDDLENVCKLLEMSKREFIEMAVGDALQKAHDLINRSGVVEQMTLGGE